MKIATWNVNSINIRKESFLKWLAQTKPDVVLLQEIKCIDEAFPKTEVEELGYNLGVHGLKGYSGVAVLSLFPIDECSTSFDGDPVPNESRYLECVISVPHKAIRIASVYVPNGGEMEDTRYKHKLKFLEALHEHMKTLLKLDEIVLIGGDFNVAPEEIDTYSVEASKGTAFFDIEVRKRFRALLNLGYCDSFRALHPNTSQFTWWDYRGASWYHNRGLRLDYILLSPEAADLLQDVQVDSKLRESVRPSDHAPVVCEIKL